LGIRLKKPYKPVAGGCGERSRKRYIDTLESKYGSQKSPGNNFHGNLILKEELTKNQITFIANMLAAAS
jgi:hypothetical protein